MPRAQSDRVRLRDIAEKAGVSAMTVSRALSGSGELVRPETAQRLRRIAAEMGYVPNLLARSLRGEQMPTLVLFAEYISSHHYLAELVDVLSRAIEERRFGVITCQSVGGLTQAVQQFNLAGAIAIAPPESFFFDEGGLPAPRMPHNTPAIVLHSAIEQDQYHEVSPDIEGMAYQAAQHLLALGHRHLAFVGGPTPELEPHWFELRRRGIQRAFQERGASMARLVQQPCADASLGEAAVQALARRSPRVTAVCCINDEIAVAVASGAARLGWSVPSQLSVVGCNDVRWARFFSPRLTTIAIDIRTLVEAGLNLLFDVIHRRIEGSQGPIRISVPTQLVVRESTAPPPQ